MRMETVHHNHQMRDQYPEIEQKDNENFNLAANFKPKMRILSAEIYGHKPFG